MALINISKPTTSLTNSTKVSFAELWSTITSTWASETRTWLDTGSLFSNQTKVTVSGLWSSSVYPWLESFPWLFGEPNPITNLNKPS